MSNAVSRGPGRGKPNQGYFTENGNQDFVTPMVYGQPNTFRPVSGQHPSQQQQYQQYPAQQYPYYQQQQQQQQQQAQQSQYNYRNEYQVYNSYYAQPPYHPEPVNYQPQPLPPQQNPAPARETKQKKVLQIVDPSSMKVIEIPNRTTPAVAPTAAPVVVAPEEVEKKVQLEREFRDKVQKELIDESQVKAGHQAAAAPVVHPPNFNYPPPAFPQNPPVQTAPAPEAKIAEAPAPEEQAEAPAATEEPAVTPISSPPAHTKSSPETDILSPESGAAESAASGAEVVTPTLTKEESKEEVEDDKFDENDSQAGDDSPSPDPENVVEKTPEELAQEKAQKEAEEVEKRKLHEAALDKRIEDLLTSGDVDTSKGMYGRDFMVAIREYEKSFHRTPCPLPPQQLTDFGLDIKSMRVADKKPNFTPNWVQNNKGNRQQNPYRGRTTTDGTGRGAQPRDRGNHKRPPPVRASIERVQRVSLPSSKDAWKPERQKKDESISEEDASTREVCKKVRALMNKITPTSQIPLTKEFISYNVSSNEIQLSQVVGIVFDKAVEEPKFCSLYAELCKSQVDHEMKLCNRKTSTFRNAVLTRTQNTFQDRKEVDDERMAVIEKEEDPAKRELMIIEERQKFRRRKFGVMTFMGFLYRNQLLSTKIVQACTFELFSSIVPKNEQELRKEDVDEESVHCALQLTETVGSMLDKAKESTPAFLDQWLKRLEAAKPYCSNKIRFMIMNLIELRNNKWVPRKSVETGPKKIDEIHNEIRQEKIENEKARDQYDRDRDRRHGGGIRTNSNSIRKQGPVSRNSIERKVFQHPEQKRAAAAATTKLAASNVQPKNISLSSMTDSSLGGKIKKEWQSGASGGGNTSEAPKSVWGRRDSDQRKKSMVDDKQSAGAAAKELGALSSSRRSGSQNSLPDNVDEDLSDEQKAKREKIMSTISSDLKEVVSGDFPMKEMVASLSEYVNAEKYANPSLTAVYEMVLRTTNDKFLKKNESKILAHVLRLSLVSKKEKQAFIEGAIKFSKFAVDVEFWQDYPHLWSSTGDVLMNMMHVPHDVLGKEKVEHLTLADMAPVFMAAKTDGKTKFDLFVQVVKRLAEAEVEETGSADGLSWEFQDLSVKEEMLKEGLAEELNITTESGKTLSSLLLQS